MPGYALRFPLLPLAVLLCVGSCLSTEGYYRYQDAGVSGTAGTTGTAGNGAGGTAGGSTGSAGSAAAGTTGAAGTVATGRGGTTGTAGSGGTTGAAGRGGTTGAAGSVGTAGAAGVLFSDNFEAGASRWNFAGVGSSALMADGSQVFSLNETAGNQYVGAAGMLSWVNQVVEARVKVLAFSGTSSSDCAAICARLTDADHFYYFALQSDGKAKIKVNDGGNSSISSSIAVPGGFQLNTWYTLKLSVVGSSLTGYINGMMVGQVTDTALAAGAVGLMVQRTNAEFDDVVVTAP
jgi:hypothetical protein